MSRLTPTQEFTVLMATRLLARHVDVLSPFEVELVCHMEGRHRLFGAEMHITDAEWPVLEHAAQALADAAKADPQVMKVRA